MKRRLEELREEQDTFLFDSLCHPSKDQIQGPEWEGIIWNVCRYHKIRSLLPLPWSVIVINDDDDAGGNCCEKQSAIVFAHSCVLLLRVPIMQSSDCSLLGLFLRAAFAEHNPEKWGNFSSWKRAALLTAYCKSYDFPKLNVPQQWCKPTVCAASTWVPVCPPCGNWGQREPMQICRCSCFLLHWE